MLQSWEDYFQYLRNHDDYTQTIVTLATALGGVSIIVAGVIVAFTVTNFVYKFGLARCMKDDLRKRYGPWAVISGATDGIGLEFAKELARRGHSIIAIGRNSEKLDNVKRQLLEILDTPDQVLTVKLDLADATIADFERVHDEIDPEKRKIGILINNAGVFPTEIKRILSYSYEDLRQMITVNSNSVVMLTRCIMPSMVERNSGLVVNVSSSLALNPTSYMGIYCATKAFVLMFSRSLSLDYCRHAIDIVALTTGPVQTKLMTGWTDKMTASYNRIISPNPDDYVRSALAAIPRSRVHTAGYYSHAIWNIFVSFCWMVGLGCLMAESSKIFARNSQLSPVPKRKSVKASVETPTDE